MGPDRRDILKSSIAGAMGALTFKVGGISQLLSAGEARAQSVPFGVLSDGEAATLEAFGEALAPGAAKGGIAHYVDSQLAMVGEESGDDALLILRYLDLPPEAWAGFYKSGLAALEAFANTRFGTPFTDLDVGQAESLIGEISGAQPADWSGGPPAPFFYFVVRADAVDIAYGTLDGYERLGVPYMAHITPTMPWKA